MLSLHPDRKIVKLDTDDLEDLDELEKMMNWSSALQVPALKGWELENPFLRSFINQFVIEKGHLLIQNIY